MIVTFRSSVLTDHKVKASEWRGKQEHDDDILSAALMKGSPAFLATGSFDGKIVLWNSATELAVKHLNQRKRQVIQEEPTDLALKKEVNLECAETLFLGRIYEAYFEITENHPKFEDYRFSKKNN
jgi:hypothetical protein